MPRVSVIIPSFNHERYLRECLESVLAQTFTDWEIVLVDDGSRDGSVEVAQEFAARDPRIRVFVNETNLGAYATENRCLDLSQGHYVAVLNSDDFWLPAKLELQVALLDRFPECPFAYCRGFKVDAQSAPIPGGIVHHEMSNDPVQDVSTKLVMDNRILASSVMFRKGVARFDPGLKYSGDWTILLKMCQVGPAAFVNEDLAFWRIHDENAHADRLRHFGEEMRVREAILANANRWLGLSKDQTEMRRSLAIGAFHLHSLFLLVGETALAKRLINRILEIDPGNRQAKRRRLFSHLPLSIQRRRICPDLNAASFCRVYPTIERSQLDIDP